MVKILVVEDSRFTRSKIAQYLTEHEYEIIEADNGKSGLEAARTQKPDCIISDILMPEMDGYKFLESLRQEGITTPVIVITADIQETTRKKVMSLGAFAVTSKPPKFSELLDQIKSALETKG